eukprot:1617641-Pyramimonas_sp.AAC.1
MLAIRTGHSDPVSVVTLGLLRRGSGRSLEREPRLCANCKENSGGSPLRMGPPDHIRNPGGSSRSRNCLPLWAPEAWIWRKSRAAALSVSELRGGLGRAPSLWGRQIVLAIRAG